MIRISRLLVWILFPSIFCGIPDTVRAWVDSPLALAPSEKKIFNRANSYFRNINTLKSNFLQKSDSSQETAKGVLYISRPGKLRLEYLSPNRSLLLCSGNSASYYDIELDEVSVIPTSRIPLIFMLEKNKDLESLGLEAIDVRQTDDGYRIYTKIIIDVVIYGVEYVFNEKMDNLLGIDINIDGDQKISLDLLDSEINITIQDSLFVFRNPHILGKRKW
jgi:outer membrane lipoprotein-sorting protein